MKDQMATGRIGYVALMVSARGEPGEQGCTIRSLRVAGRKQTHE